MPIKRVLADFEGAWRIARDIAPVGAAPASFIGTGTWSPREQGGLNYLESGTLRISGQQALRSERRYVWSEDLAVWFEDGRFFPQVPAEGGETRHWCDPDDYRVVYRFDAWPRFEVVWRVTGPRKDYTMVSSYTRSASGSV